jgi:hypothetical protein
MAQPTASEESSSPKEPIRQTIETRSVSQSAGERSTLVKAGSWRSTLAYSRQTGGLRFVQSRNNTTSDASKASPSDNRDEVPIRVVRWQHFNTALSEISPSSTEDGTLPELRKVCTNENDMV